jgi:hypothetical protein
VADDTPLSPEQVASPLPGILSRARVVVTPYPFNVSGADSLRVVSNNSVAGVVIHVHGRCAVPGFDAVPFDLTHTPNTDRTVKTEDFFVGPGFVTNLTVFASGAAPQLNQTYVIIQLVRSAGATAFLMGSLVAGPVTTTQPLGWPGSPLVSSLEGPGAVRLIIGTNPAPGVEIAEAVPSGARWRLIHFIAQLSTSAAVASRVPYLSLFVSGTRFSFYPPAASVPQTFVQYVQWATAYTTWVVGGVTAQAASMPAGLLLPAGSQVQTFTELLQAGDDWGTPELLVEEWLEVG